MFHSARLKLTVWYLAIIMTVSISFSIFIFRMVSYEFEERIRAIETRLELGGFGFRPPIGEINFFIEDIKEARRRVLLILVNTNLAVLFFSSVAGYFLAGKTLRPIENALDEQKRFVADASHELKTPLTAMQTSIEVALRDKTLNLTEAKRVIKDSLNDIDSLKRLTGDLLSLARTGSGNSTRKEDVRVDEVVKNSIKKFRPLATKNKVVIKSTLENFRAIVNKEELDKLTAILLDNAIKYSHKGGNVFVDLSRHKGCLELSVEDEGIGISKENLSRIFDRFFREDVSRAKNSTPGFGLGLSIARKIVSQSGGNIDVKSKFGKGSVFKVRLPL